VIPAGKPEPPERSNDIRRVGRGLRGRFHPEGGQSTLRPIRDESGWLTVRSSTRCMRASGSTHGCRSSWMPRHHPPPTIIPLSLQGRSWRAEGGEEAFSSQSCRDCPDCHPTEELYPAGRSQQPQTQTRTALRLMNQYVGPSGLFGIQTFSVRLNGCCSENSGPTATLMHERPHI
jgi:hypothetical protein